MAALPLNTPVPVKFADVFTTTDQNVSELSAPKPETRWCLLELPKEHLESLEKGASFYFQAQTSGKGVEDGGVALCTEKATFSVEFLENSNSLFVASIGEVPVPIAQVAVALDAAEPGKSAEAPKDGAAEPAAEAGKSAEAPKEGVAEPTAELGKDTEDAAEPSKSADSPKEGAAEPATEAGKSAEAPKGGPAEHAVELDKDTEAAVEGAAVELTAPRMQAEVFGQCRGQMIVKPVIVSKVRLQELLATQALSAQAPEESAEPPMLTKEHLAFQMAASPVELQALLDEGPYVEVDGIWRLLPTGIERDIIDATASLVTIREWNVEDIDLELLLKDAQEHVGKHALPSVAVLRKALRSVMVAPAAEKAAAEIAADTPSIGDVGGAGVASTAEGTPSGDVTESAKPPRLPLDKAKLDRFQLLQLLRVPPSQVRSRFQLPAPEPKAKRARVGPGTGRGGDGLQLTELAAALQSISGAAESLAKEQLVELLGDSAYVNELEGTVHNLPSSMLAAEPLDRLRRLLDLTSHWRAERLEALVEPVMPAGTKIATWLLKKTRAVHVEIVPGQEERFLTKKFAM